MSCICRNYLTGLRAYTYYVVGVAVGAHSKSRQPPHTLVCLAARRSPPLNPRHMCMIASGSGATAESTVVSAHAVTGHSRLFARGAPRHTASPGPCSPHRRRTAPHQALPTPVLRRQAHALTSPRLSHPRPPPRARPRRRAHTNMARGTSPYRANGAHLAPPRRPPPVRAGRGPVVIS